MSTTTQARQPGGSPASAGGRYAPTALPETGTTLTVEAPGAIPGYVPGVGVTVTLSTSDAARAVHADLAGLPANVTGYDLETDNSAGFGLDPTQGQITELVLVNGAQTIVLSGDERHILQGLADYLNARPAGEELDAWNSHGFDIPFLGRRGDLHGEHLTGWGLALHDSAVPGTFHTVGGFDQPQGLTWTTPAGGTHRDVDVMLTIKNAKLRGRGQLGLKPTARAFGAEPIELDRTRLHEYTPQERTEYVASDGLVTLHNRMHAQRLIEATTSAN